MRERGLKCVQRADAATVRGSLPMRERGLKYEVRRRARRGRVAPHAGAWIEYGVGEAGCGHDRSLPMRERGLK